MVKGIKVKVSDEAKKELKKIWKENKDKNEISIY